MRTIQNRLLVMLVGVLPLVLASCADSAGETTTSGSESPTTSTAATQPTGGAGDTTTTTISTTTTVEPLEPLDLTVGLSWSVNPAYLMLQDAAEVYGYFEDAALNVEFQRVTGSTIYQLLASGDVEVAAGSLPAAMSAYVGGVSDIRYIGGYMWENPLKDLFGASIDINTVEDLEGKTVGLSSAPGPADSLWNNLVPRLEEVGLTSDDVNWAVIGTIALRTQALVAGRIDFTLFSVEDVGIVESDPNLHVVHFPAAGGSEWLPNVSWTTRTSVTDDPKKEEAIQRFRTAMIEVSRRAVNDKEWFFDMMRTLYPDDTREFTDEELEEIWERTAAVICVNGCMRLTEVDKYVQETFLTINPEAVGVFDLEDFAEPKYVANALDELGVQEGHVDQPQLTLP